MHATLSRLALAVTLSGAATVALAAGPALGIITAEGRFRVDDATVSGNATLTDGALVETTTVPSSLRFDGGAQVRLGENAKATVYRDRLVLEAGLSELSSPGDYVVESAAYRIVPESPDAAGQIFRASGDTVEVASTRGTLRVFDARGIHVANVVAGGDVLSFALQAGGVAPPSSFLGCLLKKEGLFVLYDQTTRITVELRGNQPTMEAEWGNRVQAIGTTETTAESKVAAQVVNVTTLTRIGAGGCSTVAAAIGGELPAAAAPVAAVPAAPGQAPQQPVPAGGGGMSAGTKVLIVAGIGGAAGVGAYFGTRSGSDDRSP